jgi:hypothetical protein
MKPVKFSVTFAEHFPIDEAENMAADFIYWAPVKNRISDRMYVFHVLHEKKLSLFRRKLLNGERSGCWHSSGEISD